MCSILCTLLFEPRFTDPENMGVAEKDDFDGCVGYRRGWGAEKRRQRICRAFDDGGANADRNIFVGILRPRDGSEAGDDLSVIGRERTTAAGAAILIERSTDPSALA